jgi:hypothetical protein
MIRIVDVVSLPDSEAEPSCEHASCPAHVDDMRHRLEAACQCMLCCSAVRLGSTPVAGTGRWSCRRHACRETGPWSASDASNPTCGLRTRWSPGPHGSAACTSMCVGHVIHIIEQLSEPGMDSEIRLYEPGWATITSSNRRNAVTTPDRLHQLLLVHDSSPLWPGPSCKRHAR